MPRRSAGPTDASSNSTNFAAARRTSSLTTTASKSPTAAISISARASRAAMTSGDSVAPADQALGQHLERRRRQEHQIRLGHHRPDLAGALQLDLEQGRHAGGQPLEDGLARRAVQVAGELGVFEQLTGRDQFARTARGSRSCTAPRRSPGRGARVVHDTETQTSGCARRSSATTVPLPTPDGPDSTVSTLEPARCPRGRGRVGHDPQPTRCGRPHARRARAWRLTFRAHRVKGDDALVPGLRLGVVKETGTRRAPGGPDPRRAGQAPGRRRRGAGRVRAPAPPPGSADDDYAAAGARVVDTDGSTPTPTSSSRSAPADPDRLRAGQAVVGLLAPLLNAPRMAELAKQGVTAISLDGLPRTLTRAQGMDALSSQANVAGYKAVLVAAEHFDRFFPMLITAAGTSKPATVLVLGIGVAGLQAIGTARRLGAVVSAYDVRPNTRDEAKSLGAKFIELTSVGSAAGEGGYARAAHRRGAGRAAGRAGRPHRPARHRDHDRAGARPPAAAAGHRRRGGRDAGRLGHRRHGRVRRSAATSTARSRARRS